MLPPPPYQAIAALAASRRGTVSKPTVRTKAAVRAYAESLHASTRATDAASARVATAKAERFANAHGDYKPVTGKPVQTFSTSRHPKA